ncbi:MAG: D-2-hydroxyacid dehydrogenase [Clostridia bacterium]|nr:D-2-hydroxyacid dehydrogenase [Clostridia bacterium]
MEKQPDILLIQSGNIHEIDDARIESVRQAWPGAVLHAVHGRPIDPALLEKVEVAFGPLSPSDAVRAPRLRWVQLQSAGCENYTLPGNVFPHGRVMLTTASGVYDMPIAEHVLGMMLGHARGLFHYARQQAAGHWDRNHPVERDFAGSTVGVVGLGSIGAAVAVRSRMLGARVLGVRRHPSPDDPVDTCYTPDRLREMLPLCDYVVLCLPATVDTARVLDAGALAVMRKHAFLVNIGRGSAIDTDALVEALRAGRLGGAGLDVTDPEPLPDGHPLWGMDNVLITPHTSGGSPGDDARIHALFLENIALYRAGRPLKNLVDPAAGY